MLLSLAIKNFVLIEKAEIEFAPGFTVLTGETGAGKTLLTQALGLLLGERAGEGLVGSSGDEAMIQAVLELPEGHPAPGEGLVELAEMVEVGEGGELIATRRLSSSGRNRCFLNGVAVNLTSLGRMLGGLVAFTGQQEHRRLFEPAYQRLVLDAFAGEEAERLKKAYREEWHRARDARERLQEAGRRQSERRQERELLAFQVAELEQAGLSVAEEEELRREQALLARAEDLRLGCARAADLLSGEGEAADAAGLVGAARSALGGLQGLDGKLDRQIEAVADAAYLLADTARELRRYAEAVNVDPARREEVEQRLRLYLDLGRKYGRSGAAELVHFFQESSARLAELTAFEEGLAELEGEVAAAEGRCLELAAQLSQARKRAAPALEKAVSGELADLAMASAELPVAVTTGAGWEALNENGADSVEFLLRSNPGMPPRPLARVASGGELSRTMLAIKCALAGLESAETLVFDEIDAGIGGQTALAVGEKLRRLSRNCQLVVITHLPQVAAFADRHFLIEKDADAAHASTRLTLLDGQAALAELCRMMGGRPEEPGAMAHAEALRRRALQT